MRGNERRQKIIRMLAASKTPIAGNTLAEHFNVSRQVIVQDIARLRAEQHEITSTTSGYMLVKAPRIERVFKVIHTDEQVEDELNLIVDYGGCVEDVFIYHKVYDTVRGQLNIRSRRDVQNFITDLKTGRSSLLMNVTSGYHYHTVTADSEEILDLIQEQLREKGYLAKLQDYEPVDFWGEASEEE